MKYYSLENILSKNFDINILIGERSNGKSYAVKEECIKKAYKTGKCTFGLIRRYDSDIKGSLIESYFADMPIKKYTGGNYDLINVYRGGIYFAKIEDDKLKRGQLIGQVFALALDERYKSTEYPFMEDLIFEEFVTKNRYLDSDEPMRLMNLMSTVFRRRKGRLFMVANTISRVCPYFSEFGLRGIPTMKIGQIDSYEFEDIAGKITKIGVEYCANTGATTSGMFFGKFGKQIDGGAWECKEYARLPKDLNKYNISYRMSLKYNDFKFNILLLTDEDFLGVYVYPASLKLNDRLLTEEYSSDMMITPCLYRGKKKEEMISALFYQNKFCYSDNLTGDDFNTCVKNMKQNPFSLK